MPGASKAVQEATKATDRMADLLEELSTYARWARGDAHLMLGPVPLADVVSRAVAASHLPTSPAVTVTRLPPTSRPISRSARPANDLRAGPAWAHSWCRRSHGRKSRMAP